MFGKIMRRTQILAGMLVFGLGAFIFSIAPDYRVLVASRILMGLGASLMAERPFYQPVVYSEHGGTVPSSSGVGVDSAKLSEETRVDTWLVAGVIHP
jgi:MFS family permease